MLDVESEIIVINSSELEVHRVRVLLACQIEVLFAHFFNGSAHKAGRITQSLISRDARGVLLSDLLRVIQYAHGAHIDCDFALGEVVEVLLILKAYLLLLLVIIDPRFDALLLINDLGGVDLDVAVDLLAFALVGVEDRTQLAAHSLACWKLRAWLDVFRVDAEVEHEERLVVVICPQSSNHRLLALLSYEADVGRVNLDLHVASQTLNLGGREQLGVVFCERQVVLRRELVYSRLVAPYGELNGTDGLGQWVHEEALQLIYGAVPACYGFDEGGLEDLGIHNSLRARPIIRAR